MEEEPSNASSSKLHFSWKNSVKEAANTVVTNVHSYVKVSYTDVSPRFISIPQINFLSFYFPKEVVYSLQNFMKETYLVTLKWKFGYQEGTVTVSTHCASLRSLIPSSSSSLHNFHSSYCFHQTNQVPPFSSSVLAITASIFLFFRLCFDTILLF